jgi:hypothetical protein
MDVKAQITNLNTNEVVHCMFNPKEYVFSKQNNWEEKKSDKQNVAHLKYSGGSPANLKLQLLFDTYEGHNHHNPGEDVRTYTQGLWKMMMMTGGNREPPHVRFEWGNLWSFDAVIESIAQKFILFDASGTPLRAILDVSFKQLADEGQFPRQNPTSGGNANKRVRVVREGEHLLGIAFEEYGNAALWRHLANANPAVADPLRPQAGQTLVIEPLPAL